MRSAFRTVQCIVQRSVRIVSRPGGLLVHAGQITAVTVSDGPAQLVVCLGHGDGCVTKRSYAPAISIALNQRLIDDRMT